jgi:hypothetical protein
MFVRFRAFITIITFCSSKKWNIYDQQVDSLGWYCKNRADYVLAVKLNEAKK